MPFKYAPYVTPKIVVCSPQKNSFPSTRYEGGYDYLVGNLDTGHETRAEVFSISKLQKKMMLSLLK